MFLDLHCREWTLEENASQVYPEIRPHRHIRLHLFSIILTQSYDNIGMYMHVLYIQVATTPAILILLLPYPMTSQVHVADPDGKEMFLQLLSALKGDVAEKASTSSTSQGQDGVAPGIAEMSNPLRVIVLHLTSLFVLPVICLRIYDTHWKYEIDIN